MEELEQLKQLDTSTIEQVNMTSIGLLDVFGKLVVRIVFKDKTEKEITFISKVPLEEIKQWLIENNLVDNATLITY